MLNKLKSRLLAFKNDTQGYITLEVMISLPILFVLFAASWVFFDAYRQQSINQKANYTIGDMISRETLEIDDNYINSIQRLYYVLTRTWGTNNSQIRVSSVQYDEDDDEYSIVWSEVRGTRAELTTQSLNRQYGEHLPLMINNDTVILVETWDVYDPAFSVGLSEFDIHTYSFTSPRFSSQVVHLDSADNDGWDPANYNPQIPEFGGLAVRTATDDAETPDEAVCESADCSNESGENNTGSS